MKNIVCMKWGTLYGAEYVNKLYAMAARHITGDFRFVCLTDDPADVNSAVECLDCPSVALPPPWNNTGWRKVALWSTQLPGMEGDWLFMDLDVVITGSLDDFFTFAPERSFVVMQNWTQPGQGIGNTSVYRFTVGKHPYLLSRMVDDFMAVVKQYRNEQTFVSHVISELEFWPDEWCVLFKIQCVPPMPARWWKVPLLPPGARIVAFPGVPNPGDAAAGIWPGRKWYKKIYKHIRPAPWVSEHWRE
jgi:hypothetical protein